MSDRNRENELCRAIVRCHIKEDELPLPARASHLMVETEHMNGENPELKTTPTELYNLITKLYTEAWEIGSPEDEVARSA